MTPFRDSPDKRKQLLPQVSAQAAVYLILAALSPRGEIFPQVNALPNSYGSPAALAEKVLIVNAYRHDIDLLAIRVERHLADAEYTLLYGQHTPLRAVSALTENAERHPMVHALDNLPEALVIARHLLQTIPFAG